MKIKFSSGEWDCRLAWLTYQNNGNVAIVANDMEDGSPVGVLTVNTYEDLPNDVVAIKDYSENEGVLQSLIDNGVVDEPEDWIQTGFVKVPVCRILNRKEV